MQQWILVLGSSLLQLTAAGLLPLGPTQDIGIHVENNRFLLPPHLDSTDLGSYGTANSEALLSPGVLHNLRPPVTAYPVEAAFNSEEHSGIDNHESKMSNPGFDIDIRGGFLRADGVTEAHFHNNFKPREDYSTKECCGKEEYTHNRKSIGEKPISGSNGEYDHQVYPSHVANVPTVISKDYDIHRHPVHLENSRNFSAPQTEEMTHYFSHANAGGEARSHSLGFTAHGSYRNTGSVVGHLPESYGSRDSSFSPEGLGQKATFFGRQSTESSPSIMPEENAKVPDFHSTPLNENLRSLFPVDSATREGPVSGDSRNYHDVNLKINLETPLTGDIKSTHVTFHSNTGQTTYFLREGYSLQDSVFSDHSRGVLGDNSRQFKGQGFGGQRDIIHSINPGTHTEAFDRPTSINIPTGLPNGMQRDSQIHFKQNMKSQSQLNIEEDKSDVFPEYNRKITPAVSSNSGQETEVRKEENNSYSEHNIDVNGQSHTHHAHEAFEGY